MELDEDRLGWTVRVTRFDPAPPLVEWGLRFGEVAHHCRSVLNTMLARIAAEEGLPPNKQRQFPVVLDPGRWHHKRTGEYRRVQDFPLRVQRAVYGLQPFVQSRAHGRPPRDDVLAVLAWTDNQDKHQIELEPLLTPSSFAHRFGATFEGLPVGSRPPLRIEHDFSFRVGSALIHVDSSPHRVVALNQGEYDLFVDIAFLDENGAHTEVAKALMEFIRATDHSIETVLSVWADEGFEVDRVAGSSDFKTGAAFGKAAVDGVNRPGTWELDFRFSDRRKSYWAGEAEAEARALAGEILRTRSE